MHILINILRHCFSQFFFSRLISSQDYSWLGVLLLQKKKKKNSDPFKQQGRRRIAVTLCGLTRQLIQEVTNERFEY